MCSFGWARTATETLLDIYRVLCCIYEQEVVPLGPDVAFRQKNKNLKFCSGSFSVKSCTITSQKSLRRGCSHKEGAHLSIIAPLHPRCLGSAVIMEQLQQWKQTRHTFGQATQPPVSLEQYDQTNLFICLHRGKTLTSWVENWAKHF